LAPTPTIATTPTPIPFEGPLAGLMTKEDYPRVDGSTATIPLSEAVYHLATGATPEEAATDIVHTRTSNSYYRLMNQEVDLLIVYAPSEQVLADIKKDGDRLNIKPIGKDALVFMANAGNPVQTLTQKQLVDIYSGKLTNWAEVGGANKEILAFQRPENSGSQTLMLKLVMGQTPMAIGPNVLYYESMEGILEAMADYNNEGNTLGYSVFYYAQNMYQLPELKFMKVNGVEPSLETIYDNTYPYINEFYAVIRKEEPIDSNAHRIFDWLTGEEGQTLVKDLGYVPVDMKVSDNSDITEVLQEDELPAGYNYVAASYSTHDSLYVGTVTIYNQKWEPNRVFQNAYMQQEIGLLPEDTMLPIGYAIYQKDGSFAMQYGLYSLKEDKFVLPAAYNSLSVLDAKKGYYLVSDEEGNHVIDIHGKRIISGFMMGEGLGISKRGDYYWLYDYVMEEGKEIYRIFDADFNLMKEFYKDYNECELYEDDGTVYFSRSMFMEHFGYPEDPLKEFYLQSYRDGEALFSVYYDGASVVLDKKLNVLAEKSKEVEDNSFFDVYDDIFSRSVYNNATYSETGLFYDKKGKLILDKDGNSYTNIVGDLYWRSRAQMEYEQVLYGVSDHKLRIYRYNDGSRRNIDLGDWDLVVVAYVNNDIVVVNKLGNTQKSRVYKGNTLLCEKDGWYNISSFQSIDRTDLILLENYGDYSQGYNYILLNNKGELIYESPYLEKIMSIDDKYIQLERGNYWGVIDYQGNYIIRAIKNGLIND
jgi:ABC-type phosphate transport system substrate-binding protein